MLRAVIRFIEPYDPGLFPEDLTRLYGIPPSKIVNLGSNENPYPPPPSVLRAIRRSARSANRYPNPSYKALKERIADYVGLDESRVAVGAGAAELLDVICKIFLEPLDKVVMPVPTYTLYALLAMLRDADVKFFETESAGFRVDAQALAEASRGAKLIFIGSPNNPTGASMPTSSLRKVLESVDGFVVLDETYHEFSGESAASLVEDHENLIIVRSMSKYFSMAGLRVGYAISSREVAEAIEKVKLPFSVSKPAAEAAVKALEELPYFNKLKKRILANRDWLLKGLARFSFVKSYPSQANFILLKVLKRPFEQSLTKFFAERGVIIRDLTGMIGLRGEYARVTVGKRSENAAFLKLCEEVERLA